MLIRSSWSLASWRNVLAAAVVAALLQLIVVAALTSDSRQADAHTGDLGFKWFSNTAANTVVDDHTSCCNYWTGISNTVTNWNFNTTLNVNTGNHSSAELHYWNGNYGDTGWFGGANVYSGATLCGSANGGNTGLCNKTTVLANSAIFNLNDYYFNATWWNANATYSMAYQQQRTAGHELGHAFGFSHPPCSQDDLMVQTSCWFPWQPNSSTVDFDDIAHAAALYP